MPHEEKRSFLAHIFLLATACLALSGCTFFQSFTKQASRDGLPSDPKDISTIPEPIPTYEPKSKRGNPTTYTALGKTYRVWKSNQGYREKGRASWYGTKFAGRSTSSGEVYDLYRFTGAHRHLPIPTYARVTNLKNGKKVIIKINDRGPFTSDPHRILDLSYAAAAKLDMLQDGTAPVEIVALTPPPRNHVTPRPAILDNPPLKHNAPRQVPLLVAQAAYRIQLGAFSDKAPAEKFQQTLRQQYPNHVFEIRETFRDNKPFYRVETAPLPSRAQAEKLQAQLKSLPSIIQIG